jgi:cytochrome b subunit of formate dehydrogenase
MSIRMKVGFWCHLLAMLLIGIIGLIYLFRSQFMPYHAIAVGKTWAEVDPAFQILLLALIRVVGGAWIATALAMGILLFIPFRQGIRWARWAVPTIGLVAELTALYVTLSVTLNTPATPPWKGVVLIMVLLVAGFILSLEPEKKKEHIVERSGA